MILSAQRRAVWALALGQMLGYACIYYVFAALVLAWHQDLGWDKAVLASGPTIAIVLSAVLAPVFGRLVDRGQGVRLLWGGAALGALALVLLARINTIPAYLAVWAVIGLAQGASLYEVCFAYLIRRLGPDARSAIIKVTLVAGLASTLAFPAAAVLVGAWGWRGAVGVAAAVMAVLVVPLNLWGARTIRATTIAATLPSPTDDRAALHRALRLPTFWLLALAFALSALNHWMVVNLALPVFQAQGASQGMAVLAASMIGPAQVAGRLVLMGAHARVSSRRVAGLTIAASLVASALLWAAGIAVPLILAYAVLQGAAVGVVTILRPVMIAELLGQAGYGAIAGVIYIPSLLAGAAAPVVGALVLSWAGVGALMGFSVVLLVLMGLVVVALPRGPGSGDAGQGPNG